MQISDQGQKIAAKSALGPESGLEGVKPVTVGNDIGDAPSITSTAPDIPQLWIKPRIGEQRIRRPSRIRQLALATLRQVSMLPTLPKHNLNSLKASAR